MYNRSANISYHSLFFFTVSSSSQCSPPHSLLLLMTTPTSGPHGQQLAILGCYNLTPCDPYISFSGLQHSLSGLEGLLGALPMMSFCQTSSVFSDPLDLLDHPLLLDIFFRGAPQLRAGVEFYFFTKCPLRNTLVVTFKLCYCALEIEQNSVSIHM